MGLTSQETGKLVGRPPKFNYDGDDFYDEIYALAMNGLTDKEIADALEDRFGESLSKDTFSEMKNGRYDQWSEEENERRSARINRQLTRARNKLNSVVRGAYLKSGLGGKPLRNYYYGGNPCVCGGKDPNCQICRGTGFPITNITEQELPPDKQVLANWLYHHDPEWRAVQDGKRAAEQATAAPSLKIEMVYTDAKDLEIQSGSPDDYSTKQ